MSNYRLHCSSLITQAAFFILPLDALSGPCQILMIEFFVETGHLVLLA